MKANFAIVKVLLCLTVSVNGFAQVNSSIGGTVEDSSKALLPGVQITATNTGTGVSSSTVSNESGAYNFPAILPGNYKVTAELPGFKPFTYSEVNVSPGNPVRLNFTLEVGGVTQSVEVTVASDSLLATSSASVGEILTEKRVIDLPLVSNNVLDLVRILPGFRESPGGNAFDTFAGQASSTVNTVRDGLSVTDGRFNNGVFSTTTINPDLVGEVRLVLTPVDAELGRGNAQVLIFTLRYEYFRGHSHMEHSQHGVGSEYVAEQSHDRPHHRKNSTAELVQQQRIRCQLWRTHQEEQVILLHIVGTEHAP
jgi:carboxypeptidase family protein